MQVELEFRVWIFESRRKSEKSSDKRLLNVCEKRRVGEGAVQSAEVSLLLGMNVLTEIVQGWRNDFERTLHPDMQEQWDRCLGAVEARLKVMPHPPEAVL